jgi:drug/metabolite transporter (DMT)-like permease
MRARPYLLLLLLGVVWGVHWPVSKIGLQDLPPFTYGAFRIGTGLAVIVAFLAVRRGLRLPARHDLPIILMVGLGQMAAGIALMNLALQETSAGRSSILVYTMPLWVAVFQFSALRSRGGWPIAGLALGLAGIVILLNPQAIDWRSSGELLGSGALLLSAAMWAVTTIYIRHHRWAGTPLGLMPWQLLVGAVPLIAAALVLESGKPIHWEPGAIVAVLYSGPLATALAFWLSQSISRSLSPLATTMGFLAVPVVGLVSSWIILGEPLTLLDLAGAAITFLGIVVVSLATSPEGGPSDPAIAAEVMSPGAATSHGA